MYKKVFFSLAASLLIPSLFAADAAPAAEAEKPAAPAVEAEKPAVPEIPDVFKEDFNNSRRYVVQKVQTHDAKGKISRQVNTGCRREYKDGTLILHYKLNSSNHQKDYGSFTFGLAKRLDLKGSNILEMRYRVPKTGIGNTLTWTYADEKGKLHGDWINVPSRVSEDWKTLTVEMDKSGFNGKKRLAQGKPMPKPVKLVTFQIYSNVRFDDEEHSIEIDYFRIPGAAPAAAEVANK